LGPGGGRFPGLTMRQTVRGGESVAGEGDGGHVTLHEPGRVGVSRRTFVRAAGVGTGFVLYGRLPGGVARALASIPGGNLDTSQLPRFTTPLLVPPVMPRADVLQHRGSAVDYYEISMRQFRQQMLPEGYPATTVWGYGPVSARSQDAVMLHHAPSLTIEARADRPVRIKWVNSLVDRHGRYLPHLLTVDPTLHWANPPQQPTDPEGRPLFDETPPPYTGPVPIVTHVHGAVDVGDESDGYTEAWYLPAARNIPSGYLAQGPWYARFAKQARHRFGVRWGPGFAVFQYPNTDRPRINWYHDHALGMTRLNVYTGPAGFYLLRGPEDRRVRDTRTGAPARLPGPPPREGDQFPSHQRYREIPLAIQDRAFNRDGSLFYPDSRTFFDGAVPPFVPNGDFYPYWNPEFFGNTIIVNGSTWPVLDVDQVRYRLRLLNGCQSRFLILDFSAVPRIRVWQIGNEGGYLAAPIDLARHGHGLLLGPAERADLIVDFGAVPVGSHTLRNVGPDEPFGGGLPGIDFEPADPDTTGQVLQFRVRRGGSDPSTPPRFLRLPPPPRFPIQHRTRRLALVEQAGTGVDTEGRPVEGPVEALLGTVENGMVVPREWHQEVTENPREGDTELWEFYNTTADAHPIHVHEVAFQVVGRQALRVDQQGEVVQPVHLTGPVLPPHPGESGVKDTVIAYPGQVTRIRATFDTPGRYVWHCHILEHEDNEMMRPLQVHPRDGAIG
jgi:spore coat protein A, manganese oxidase